ncbi:hypothetical protein BDAP_000133 [Binucleata daphniae]
MNKEEENKHKLIRKIMLTIHNNLFCNKNDFIVDSDVIYFKNYMSVKFEEIRNACNIKENEFMNSFKIEYFLKKSHVGKKSLIFYTANFRFVVKTIRKREKDVLVSILDNYVKYVKKGDTILSKIYGCYRIKSTFYGVFYVIVMDCVFNSPNMMHEIYDLKGSMHGRYAQNLSYVTLKDCDWKTRNKKLYLNDDAKKMYSMMERDVEFLERNNILDYSLVLGIKYIENTKLLRFYSFYTEKDNRIVLVEDKSEIFKKSLPVAEVCNATFTSYQNNEKVFYNVGIVDFLTNWSILKKLEYYFSILTCKKNFSCVHPSCYRERFLKMANEVLCENKNEEKNR